MSLSYPDRLVEVDLSKRSVSRIRIPESWVEQFIGGKGLGARFLYDAVEAGVEPLSPDNALLFMVGPLSGLAPGEPRYAAITKSPLTGAFLDSYSGGTFAARLAGSLGDAMGIMVTGRADEPVALEVDDGSVSITSVPDLDGASVQDTCDRYPEASVACIGPAGESEVVYATIASDRGEHHAGRGGAGAVMGSKNLKAVIASGDPPEGLDDLRRTSEERFAEDTEGSWHVASETVESIDFANEVGALSTRGWQETTFEGAEDIGIEAVRQVVAEREHEGEPIPGGFRIRVNGKESTPRGATQMTLGAGLGIDDFEDIAVLGEMCNRLGVDIIGVGNAVAWAIRANEAGYIEFDGEFGDVEAAADLIEAIANRESALGDALADGIARAASIHGGEDLIPTVKGMELPSYDPRRASGMALAYATSDRGACHRRARPIETEVFDPNLDEPTRKAREVATEQDFRSLLWSLIADDFTGQVFAEDYGAEWLAAVGLDLSTAELRTAGERIWNLTRAFNAREGFARGDDELPPVLERPATDGPASGESVDPAEFEAMLEAYYDIRGWDENGLPTPQTLSQLGLEDVAESLYAQVERN